MANLLKNGGFDEGFRAWNGIENVTVANSWLPFWVAHLPQDPDWKNQRPVYRPALRAVDARRARGGPSAQMYSSNWATHIAGIMQIVDGVTLGDLLRLSVFAHSWSTNSDVPDQSIDAGNLLLKIGIDPLGGTNPMDARIVWSPERVNYDLFQNFSVEAHAQGTRITVFLFSAVEWPKKHNDVFWDDATLDVIVAPEAALGAERDVLLAISSISPTSQVGALVNIDVTAIRQLTNPSLLISGPQGAIDARAGASGAGGRGYTWHWDFTPQTPGPYTVTFRSDELPSVSSTVQISPVSVIAPPVVMPTAVAGAARGLPRTQYHRVYFLLPPTAGKEWIQAVLDSGIWLKNRWTIGYSADDAGIGDLGQRTVIALNPPAWPDPIIPWLQMWYPGVQVFPITAVSPTDLKAILQSMEDTQSSGVNPELG